MSTSFPPSIATMSDLDGFSIAGDNQYGQINPSLFQLEGNDFGFDPAPISVKMEAYSPISNHQVFGDFEFDPVRHTPQDTTMRAMELQPVQGQQLPQSVNAVSRFGQVTPPRSNSESSMDRLEKPIRQKRAPRTSTTNKAEQSEVYAPSPATGRKRRNTRKNSSVSSGVMEEDDRRKQSLEKNRLAAAKCRVNKKEKTEQLQRDSHDKAVHNALLKEQLMHMKEEVQRINALLLTHANCEGCKSPTELNNHLSALGNEFLTNLPKPSREYNSFSAQMDDFEQEQYYSPSTDTSLNPPLPEFKQESEFEATTPMYID